MLDKMIGQVAAPFVFFAGFAAFGSTRFFNFQDKAIVAAVGVLAACFAVYLHYRTLDEVQRTIVVKAAGSGFAALLFIALIPHLVPAAANWWLSANAWVLGIAAFLCAWVHERLKMA